MTVAVNQRVRAEHGANGTLVVMSAWCEQCGQQVMPTDSGHCAFCRSFIVDEDSLPVRELLAEIESRHTNSNGNGGLGEAPESDDMGPDGNGASPSPPASTARRMRHRGLRAVIAGMRAAADALEQELA